VGVAETKPASTFSYGTLHDQNSIKRRMRKLLFRRLSLSAEAGSIDGFRRGSMDGEPARFEWLGVMPLKKARRTMRVSMDRTIAATIHRFTENSIRPHLL
jgi:hypothetical protein